MSIIGQTEKDDHPGDDPNAFRPVVVISRDILGPSQTSWHSHKRAQLVFAAKGFMTVSSRQGTWVVPSDQAVWVPIGLEHQVETKGPLSLRSLYLHEDALSGLPKEIVVLRVSPLLRALILRLADLPVRYEPKSPAARIAAVIPDEVRELEAEPLHLPFPRDRRLFKVTETLIADPADDRSLSDWARESAASERTLARLFIKETGMTFGTWRQRRRLIEAVARLAEGQAVTGVALDLGYDSPSAFISMFKKELGTTPGRYLSGS